MDLPDVLAFHIKWRASFEEVTAGKLLKHGIIF